MLKITDLTVRFHQGSMHEKTALSHLSLHLKKGDFVTVIGSNGAGKSTLFQAISGAVPISGGSIYLNEKDITHCKEYQRARLIGRLFQDPLKGTAPSMTIAENLSLASCRGHHFRLKGVTDFQRQQMYQALLELDLGLEKRLDERVGILSGGQRQALTLLMATYEKPQLLLLDEHTAALDPQTAKKILKITSQMIQKYHMTAMMITHNMEDALTYGQKLLIMKNGQIINCLDEQQKKKMTVNDLIKLYTTQTQEYCDRLLL